MRCSHSHQPVPAAAPSLLAGRNGEERCIMSVVIQVGAERLYHPDTEFSDPFYIQCGYR
jgi:hypothetical protein